MLQIKLLGYRTIEPNEVFAKKQEPIKNPETGRKIKVEKVTILSRYSAPTQSDAVNYIIDHIGIYKEGSEAEKEREIEQHPQIEKIPEEMVELILKRNKKTIENIIANLPSLPVKKEGDYITVATAAVLAKDLQLAQEKRKEGVEGIYNRLISLRGLYFWNAKTRLEKDGSFPNNGDLDILLANEVTSSKVINVTGKYQNYEEVVQHFNTLADSLRSPVMVKQIPDLSTELLRFYTMQALDSLLKEGQPYAISTISIDIKEILPDINNFMSSHQGQQEQNSEDSRNPDDSGSYRAINLN